MAAARFEGFVPGMWNYGRQVGPELGSHFRNLRGFEWLVSLKRGYGGLGDLLASTETPDERRMEKAAVGACSNQNPAAAYLRDPARSRFMKVSRPDERGRTSISRYFGHILTVRLFQKALLFS